MKLYLVRHGITDWNARKKIQGQVDIPLNEEGKRLARETAEGLSDVPFDLCISSPLCRAKETARIILRNRKTLILEDPRIMEMAFGEYEGKCCSKEGWDVPESFHRFFDDPAGYQPPEGGESFEDVKKRTGEFLESLYKKDAYQELDILITTHGAALAGLLNNIKSCLHMLSGNTAVIRTEPVGHNFKLCRHTIVIKRCCKNNHISVQDGLSYFLIVIMQDAGSFISACHASGTWTDIHLVKIKPYDTVPCRFRSFAEILN